MKYTPIFIFSQYMAGKRDLIIKGTDGMNRKKKNQIV